MSTLIQPPKRRASGSAPASPSKEIIKNLNEHYWGVTTIISKTMPQSAKTRLEASHAKGIERLGAEKFQELLAADKARGRTVDAAIKKFFADRVLPLDLPPTLKGYGDALEASLNSISPECVMFVDREIRHEVFRYFGELDLCAVIGGKLTVVEYKTGTKSKPGNWMESHKLQAVSYAVGLEHEYRHISLKVEKLLIVHAFAAQEGGYYIHPGLNMVEVSGSELEYYRNEWQERLKAFQIMLSNGQIEPLLIERVLSESESEIEDQASEGEL